jgi:hypothetical protein
MKNVFYLCGEQMFLATYYSFYSFNWNLENFTDKTE